MANTRWIAATRTSGRSRSVSALARIASSVDCRPRAADCYRLGRPSCGSGGIPARRARAGRRRCGSTCCRHRRHRRQARGLPSCDDKVHLETDELGGKRLESIVIALGPVRLKVDVLPLHVTELAHLRAERIPPLLSGGIGRAVVVIAWGQELRFLYLAGDLRPTGRTWGVRRVPGSHLRSSTAVLPLLHRAPLFVVGRPPPTAMSTPFVQPHEHMTTQSAISPTRSPDPPVAGATAGS